MSRRYSIKGHLRFVNLSTGGHHCFRSAPCRENHTADMAFMLFFLIGADLSLSIAISTASTCIVFLFITLNTFLYVTTVLDSLHDNSDRKVEIDWIGILTTTLALIIESIYHGRMYGLLNVF